MKYFTLLCVLRTDKHVAVSGVGNGEEMRRHLSATFALVLGDDVGSVDGQATVRVDDDTEQTRVRLSQTDDIMQLRPGSSKAISPR